MLTRVLHSATLKGGIGGGLAGAALGFAGVYGATLRYPAFRSLTLPLKAFLITSSGTFAGKLRFDSLVEKMVDFVGIQWSRKQGLELGAMTCTPK